MMSFVIGFLTVVLVLDCVFLILLVLIQLPKKEAGAGLAFGGGATDALFGAGSGTALTKITKYAAGVFLGLSLLLSVMRTQHAEQSGRSFEEQLKKRAASGPVPVASMTPTNASSSTNAMLNLLASPSNAPPTNAPPAATPTNTPAAAPK